MTTDRAEIVEVRRPLIWKESDLFGSIHICVQHEGFEPFRFVSIHYQYPYTDNAGNHSLSEKIMTMLGGQQC